MSEPLKIDQDPADLESARMAIAVRSAAVTTALESLRALPDSREFEESFVRADLAVSTSGRPLTLASAKEELAALAVASAELDRVRGILSGDDERAIRAKIAEENTRYMSRQAEIAELNLEIGAINGQIVELNRAVVEAKATVDELKGHPALQQVRNLRNEIAEVESLQRRADRSLSLLTGLAVAKGIIGSADDLPAELARLERLEISQREAAATVPLGTSGTTRVVRYPTQKP